MPNRAANLTTEYQVKPRARQWPLSRFGQSVQLAVNGALSRETVFQKKGAASPAVLAFIAAYADRMADLLESSR